MGRPLIFGGYATLAHMANKDSMVGINTYFQDFAPGAHREAIGGMWDEVGALQANFLLTMGLKPENTLLDMGCGSLRGGVKFVEYLNEGNYYGLDINDSLIAGGREELAKAGLESKNANLLVDDAFKASQFKVDFDYALAISVLTHLSMDHIARCLAEIKDCLAPAGRFFGTYFEAPRSVHLEEIPQVQGGPVTQYDRDPFHQSFEELSMLASLVGLRADRIGPWGHPRGQFMAVFSHA